MPDELNVGNHQSAGNYAALMEELLDDARHGWSMGTFGAVGEFIRDDSEPVIRTSTATERCLYTARAAIRVKLDIEPCLIAYDTLLGDGGCLAGDRESWGHTLAVCLPMPENAHRGVIKSLGQDTEAVRAEDREAAIFDLGAGIGHVRFCLRTQDQGLINALLGMQNQDVFGPDGGALMAEVMRAQPHRVMISPVGRIEVFAAIPLPGGESPAGPHTHLLPQLVRLERTHDSNAPIPPGFQPVLMFHPRSPWHDALGRRAPFDSGLNADFMRLLDLHGLPDEASIRSEVESAIASGVRPDAFAWPKNRRGRAVARLTLRRIAQRRPGDVVAAWRVHHDHAEEE
jgi:hypothetical protein